MVLFVRQKIFSLADKFTIKDEGGQDRWTVRGELWSWSKVLHLEDLRGRERLTVRQRLWSLWPRFELTIDGAAPITARQRFAWLRQRWDLEGTGLRADGNWTAHEYTVAEGGRTVVTITKEWMSWGDSYRVLVTDPHRELLALGLVLAIDASLAMTQNS